MSVKLNNNVLSINLDNLVYNIQTYDYQGDRFLRKTISKAYNLGLRYFGVGNRTLLTVSYLQRINPNEWYPQDLRGMFGESNESDLPIDVQRDVHVIVDKNDLLRLCEDIRQKMLSMHGQSNGSHTPMQAAYDQNPSQVFGMRSNQIFTGAAAQNLTNFQRTTPFTLNEFDHSYLIGLNAYLSLESTYPRSYRQESSRRQEQSSNEDEADLFQEYVESSNTQRLDQARVSNNDGKEFLTEIIKQNLNQKSSEERKVIEEKLSESDGEILYQIAHLAVLSLVTKKEMLNEDTIPKFAIKQLKDLKNIQQEVKTFTKEEQTFLSQLLEDDKSTPLSNLNDQQIKKVKEACIAIKGMGSQFMQGNSGFIASLQSAINEVIN